MKILLAITLTLIAGLGDAFAQTFESLGGTIVARQSFSKGDSDFRPQLTSIKQTRPEAVFVPGYCNDAIRSARSSWSWK